MEGYILPLEEQWDVLQVLVQDLQGTHPADQEFRPPAYSDTSRDTIVSAVAGLMMERMYGNRYLTATSLLTRTHSHDLENHPPTPINPPSPTPSASEASESDAVPSSSEDGSSSDESAASVISGDGSPTPTPAPEVVGAIASRGEGSPSPGPEVDFFEDLDANTPHEVPQQWQILWHNLPVGDIALWEVSEYDRIYARASRARLLSGESFSVVDVHSGNVWGFGPYGALSYIERSAAMEWALYLADLCGTYGDHHPPVPYPIMPNPHGVRSRQSVSGLDEPREPGRIPLHRTPWQAGYFVTQ